MDDWLSSRRGCRSRGSNPCRCGTCPGADGESLPRSDHGPAQAVGALHGSNGGAVALGDGGEVLPAPDDVDDWLANRCGRFGTSRSVDRESLPRSDHGPAQAVGALHGGNGGAVALGDRGEILPPLNDMGHRLPGGLGRQGGVRPRQHERAEYARESDVSEQPSLSHWQTFV